MTAPPQDRSFRRILANLDCESDFEALYRAERSPRGTPKPTLSRAALHSASLLGTLLRVFATDDRDRLWTPAPLNQDSLVEVPGLPRPTLESGPLGKLAPAGQVLAWGATRHARPGPSRAPSSAPLHELLWDLPPADSRVATAAHDRAFTLEMGRRLGCALPGSRMLSSTRELGQHLDSLGAELEGLDFDPDGAWVVKAPFSAAGRARHVGRGRPTAGDRRRLDRLFERHGRLLIEPWLDRTADYGLAALVVDDTPRLVSFHRARVDRRGTIRGLDFPAVFDPDLHEIETPARIRLRQVVDEVGRVLATRGYSGPFGIDCWRYRVAGRSAWHPLGEINVRMTLGLVGRALVDRLREPLAIDARSTVRLRWGAAPPPGARLLAVSPTSSRAPRAVWATVE